MKTSEPRLVLDLNAGPAATPMAFIRAIVQGYRRYGSSPSNALNRAGITYFDLEKPEARVTAAQMEVVSYIAMQELDDEAIGWFSRRLPWGSYGMLCRASLTSPNLGIALKRWCRHHRLLTEDLELRLEQSRGTATLSVQPNTDLGGFHEFCLMTSLRYALGYACWSIDSRIPLVLSRFPYAEPPHSEVYPLLFDCPIEFSADLAELRFDAAYLDQPIRRDEHALQQMLQRALPLTVLKYRRDRLLIQRVRERLWAAPPNGRTAESIAAELHLSTRTLHRHLQEEGASFQQLKSNDQRARSIDLLCRSRHPINKIASLVGFRNEKSFSRAFRNWTGTTPSAFREQATCKSHPGT